VPRYEFGADMSAMSLYKATITGLRQAMEGMAHMQKRINNSQQQTQQQVPFHPAHNLYHGSALALLRWSGILICYWQKAEVT
jgi:hypothetical protein